MVSLPPTPPTPFSLPTQMHILSGFSSQQSLLWAWGRSSSGIFWFFSARNQTQDLIHFRQELYL